MRDSLVSEYVKFLRWEGGVHFIVNFFSIKEFSLVRICLVSKTEEKILKFLKFNNSTLSMRHSDRLNPDSMISMKKKWKEGALWKNVF